ncbi:hypothetical protein IGI37_003742 [Enterococcus sp. AZ194]|uniref:CPBP family intramembrane glutamic endopeptidase n=1 Tax=Enterococcus sp. AZ194 TaxID=2774629 RepID=UPI003F29967E
MVIEELLNAGMNLLVFTSLPFIWWGLFHRKRWHFFQWVGLKKPIVSNKKRLCVLFVVTILIFTVMSWYVDSVIPNTVQLASQRFAGKRFEGLLPALIFSFIKTGLSEELFFRGFLGKVLSRKFSFYIGNSIQALIFGYLHGAMLLAISGIGVAVLVTLFTGTIGWVNGYLNERYAGGSIIPSWCLHGIANFISALFDLFRKFYNQVSH